MESTATASRWAGIDGANRNDVRLLEPTLDAISAGGWTDEIETMHLDRGYHYPKICLATTVLIVGKLLTWRDRWDPR